MTAVRWSTCRPNSLTDARTPQYILTPHKGVKVELTAPEKVRWVLAEGVERKILNHRYFQPAHLIPRVVMGKRGAS